MDTRARRPLVWIVAAHILLAASAARADNFTAARYDAAHDQLIVTLVYRGTNPDHAFTLTWGACQSEHGVPTVSGEVLDSQAQDAAQREFRKTVNFNLAGIPCRPAHVVLRTAPRFYIGVQVPAAP